MSKVMFQFLHPDAEAPPTIESVAERFGLEPRELDHDYGIVKVEPGRYVTLVDEDARARIEARIPAEDAADGAGLFANPRIEPFGPPQP